MPSCTTVAHSPLNSDYFATSSCRACYQGLSVSPLSSLCLCITSVGFCFLKLFSVFSLHFLVIVSLFVLFVLSDTGLYFHAYRISKMLLAK